jgi:hypothetical protein
VEIEIAAAPESRHGERDVNSHLKESYKKMSVAELKMRAISMAKCADPSKMKKQELVTMLLSAAL